MFSIYFQTIKIKIKPKNVSVNQYYSENDLTFSYNDKSDHKHVETCSVDNTEQIVSRGTRIYIYINLRTHICTQCNIRKYTNTYRTQDTCAQ